jgi:hypothetical protein
MVHPWIRHSNLPGKRVTMVYSNLISISSLVLESIIVFLEVREEEQKHSKMNYGNEPGGNLPTLRVFVGSAQRIPRFLVTVDRQLTTFLGRPSAISSEEWVEPLTETNSFPELLSALRLTIPKNVTTNTG